MESLGDKLKETRESKGYSYEHVGRETNIARRYITALEEEDFAKFPGESYLLGFLRNYGEYLGLDINELLSLYRAIKIQEQPVPMEQLLKSPPSVPKILIALCIILPFLGAGAAAWYFLYFRPPAAPVHNEAAPLPGVYTIDAGEGVLERRFYRGDVIVVPLGNERYKVELRSMDDPLTLTTPGGGAVLSLVEDTGVDLNGDGIADMWVSLSDYDKSVPVAGAFLRFVLNDSAVPGAAQSSALQGQPAGAGTTIFTYTTASPITLDVQFQGACYFRWEVNRRDRTERYFSRGEKLTIPVRDTIRFWTTNAAASAVTLTVMGRAAPLDIGGAGEVAVIELRWLMDNEGRYRLVQDRLED